MLQLRVTNGLKVPGEVSPQVTVENIGSPYRPWLRVFNGLKGPKDVSPGQRPVEGRKIKKRLERAKDNSEVLCKT